MLQYFAEMNASSSEHKHKTLFLYWRISPSTPQLRVRCSHSGICARSSPILEDQDKPQCNGQYEDEQHGCSAGEHAGHVKRLI